MHNLFEIDELYILTYSNYDAKTFKLIDNKFLIVYIPESLCWTEVPASMTIFLRQRVRWARGLIQTLFLHKKTIFNPKYGMTGLVILPYYLFFEFAVPILEILGLIVLTLDFLFFSINYNFLFFSPSNKEFALK